MHQGTILGRIQSQCLDLSSKQLPKLLQGETLNTLEMNVEGQIVPLPRVLYDVSPNEHYVLASTRSVGLVLRSASSACVRQFTVGQCRLSLDVCSLPCMILIRLQVAVCVSLVMMISNFNLIDFYESYWGQDSYGAAGGSPSGYQQPISFYCQVSSCD